MLVTVFTPTYNRAYHLSALYKSLQKQTSKDFEWLVIDDGSTDNTEELVKKWLNEKLFPVRYIKQSNGGKHRAINLGVKEAQGELFFIVDSDDELSDESITRITDAYAEVKGDDSFGGVCGLKCYPDGSKVGGGENFGVLDCNSLDFRYRYKFKGDMAEVIRTDVMKLFPFPEFENEKFCPEALFFNRVAQKYKLHYFYENIYVCEYLPDGLTAKITKIRRESPNASMLCYSEIVHYSIPFKCKLRAAVNYWRFSFCSELGIIEQIKKIGFAWSIFSPIGYMFYLVDCFLQKK